VWAAEQHDEHGYSVGYCIFCESEKSVEIAVVKQNENYDNITEYDYRAIRARQ